MRLLTVSALAALTLCVVGCPKKADDQPAPAASTSASAKPADKSDKGDKGKSDKTEKASADQGLVHGVKGREMPAKVKLADDEAKLEKDAEKDAGSGAVQWGVARGSISDESLVKLRAKPQTIAYMAQNADKPEVVIGALQELVDIGNYGTPKVDFKPEWKPILLARMTDKDVHIAGSACLTAGDALKGDQDIQKVLIETCKGHDNDTVRGASCYAVGVHDGDLQPADIAALTSALDDKSGFVVYQTLDTLQDHSVRNDAPFTKALSLLKSDDASIRGKAADYLGSYLSSSDTSDDQLSKATDALTPLLKDSSGYARAEAGASLAAMKGWSQVDTLLPLLEDNAKPEESTIKYKLLWADHDEEDTYDVRSGDDAVQQTVLNALAWKARDVDKTPFKATVDITDDNFAKVKPQFAAWWKTNAAALKKADTKGDDK